MKTSLLVIRPPLNAEKDACEHAESPLWSSALSVILEKRGWLSAAYVRSDSCAFEDRLAEADALILCDQGSAERNQAMRDRVARSGQPVLAEGPSGQPDVNCNPPAGPGGLKPQLELDIVDSTVAQALVDRIPSSISRAPNRLLLADADFSTWPAEPDILTSTAVADRCASAAVLAGSLAARELVQLERRVRARGSLAEDAELDAQMAIYLCELASQLPSSRHGQTYDAFISDQRTRVLARSDLIDGGARRRLAQWGTDPADGGDRLPGEQTALDVAGQLRTAGSDHWSALKSVPHTNVPSLLGALGWLYFERPDLCQRLFIELRDRLFDADKGAFRNAVIRRGEVEPGDTFVSHPMLLLALAKIAEGIDLPDPGGLIATAFTERQRALWDRPVLRWVSLEAGEDDHVILVESTSGAPLLVERGKVLELGFNLLSWLVHQHTRGPLSEPYGEADAIQLIVAEELLDLLIGRLSNGAARPVPRIAPWPSGHQFAVVIRHDVDRIPDEDSFRRLLSFYRSRNLRASWYWIAWRLDREKISALCSAGHENGLHALRHDGKAAELREVSEQQPALRTVCGETLHGTAADYWLGAASVLTAQREGLSYTEFAPNAIQYPYAGYPWLNSDGGVDVLRGPIGLTQNVLADSAMGRQRKHVPCGQDGFQDVAVALNSVVVVLNHPDVCFESLKDLVAKLMDQDGLFWTASELTYWWHRTHQATQLLITWLSDTLLVHTQTAVSGLVLELPADRIQRVRGSAIERSWTQGETLYVQLSTVAMRASQIDIETA